MSTALRHTRDSVRIVQDALAGWASRLLRDAGAEAAGGPRVGLYPLRAAPVSRSGDAQGLPLLTPAELARDAPGGVAPGWAELARTLQPALELVFPRPDARPGPASRPRPAPAIESLPAPLAAWYRARGAEWSWEYDGALRARAPSLMWRGPLSIRLTYLLSVENAGDDTLPLLAAVASAMSFENSFDVRLPALPVDPLVPVFASALADSVEGEVASELRAAAGRLSELPVTTVSVSPGSELSVAQLAQLVAASGRPGVPHLQLVLGVSAGGSVIFAPAAVPAFAGRPRDRE